ncbi:MAG TPA: CHAD domain-containing protein [Solirubrobacterales bacterium]
MSARAKRGIGRAASEGEGEVAGRSRSYRLKGGESPAEGIRRIAVGRADKAVEELGGGELAESIHSGRKDLKKLRSALRLVRGELGDDLYRAENRRYRDAGRLLAQSRDAEVKVETLRSLRERFGEELPRDLADAWLAALERERDEIAGKAGSEGGSRIAEARAAIAAGRAAIDDWPLRDDSWQLVEAGLLSSYRRGRRAMNRTRKNPSAENVHEWRKRTKDLWYQLRILRDAWKPVLGETTDQAHGLADLLGDHHDLAVLVEDLASRELPGDRDAVRTAIDRRQQELLDGAFDTGARLFGEKPKAFGRRLESYWVAWRSG